MSDWRQRAACLGCNPDLWFPERGDSAPAQTAIKVCHGCPVKAECLHEHIWERTGIFGATTPEQRVKLRRGLRLTRQPLPINHGTAGGYVTHKRRGEEPCVPCRIAHAAYHQRREGNVA